MDPRTEFQKRHDEYQKQKLSSHIHHKKRNKPLKKHPFNIFYVIGGIIALILLAPILLRISQL